MGQAVWHPKWWSKDKHESAWERVKEAMHRDWVQTKQDFGMKGGKELHQDLDNTVSQAFGAEPIPWEDASVPLAFGYGARHQYGAQHAAWNDDLETELKTEWEQNPDAKRHGWNDIRGYVRRGYEHQ